MKIRLPFCLLAVALWLLFLAIGIIVYGADTPTEKGAAMPTTRNYPMCPDCHCGTDIRFVARNGDINMMECPCGYQGASITFFKSEGNAIMAKQAIQTNLLGKRVSLVESHPNVPEGLRGGGATIVSVYLDPEGNPRYTLRLWLTSKLFDCYDSLFTMRDGD